jgi:hypothetical protein
MMILAVLAAATTVFGLDDGIMGLQAGYGTAFFAGTLVLPIALWIGTIYFYGRYKKEKASPP